ncbi:NgoBV family restriction endonuclease [Nostoc sp. UHCC 0870]|uniref:NgoBV family restriction endonuclease n=1 Tax=Nostoc sp. UHCC 0870 TaxID=2914041 RepID=UPI001EDDB234|nr:NgoBV family restriction endonuclease [Nostoc sp. UHCC 0870]UKO99437.1 NgoBV family restriction endonuclease [Nostoc sp. UHCC 0870]
MTYHPIANHIYKLLIQEQVIHSEGKIIFNFLNTSIEINDKSAFGYLFQEWLAEWMRQKEIKFRTTLNTQEFPDFLLEQDDNNIGLLEIKTFDYHASANFDVANFRAYCRSLKKQAYRLDADYLIFAYEFKNYRFKIQNIWLKKIWEITGKSDYYPVKCQVKQNEIVNIRPVLWYSLRAKYKPFNSRLLFVEALYQNLMQYKNTKDDSVDWLKEVKNNYLFHTGAQI